MTVNKAGFGSKSLDRAASVGLVGFDRHTGKQLWTIDAKHSFWHNGIVAGADKIYCLDKFPSHIEEAMRRRGKPLPASYRIAAIDYLTGKISWEITEGVFGTWLGYSEQHDLLLHAGAQASDRLTTETGRGMTVFRGTDGSVHWKNESLAYSGPCILHNDLIITNANAYSESAGAFYIHTGKQKLVKNPLTGETQPWKITRAYGCNNIIASENMLTFRSGAAGFYDLLNECGTGNLGGFKSGCTSNLVVANGVLNAPDYTRTCSCSYQNQTSLALVHMPDIDLWTVDSANARATPEKAIERIAINFGAPGDRRDSDGQLWMEYPTLAGESATVKIHVNLDAKYFQHHSSLIAASERPWVLSSGVDNIKELDIKLRVESLTRSNRGCPSSMLTMTLKRMRRAWSILPVVTWIWSKMAENSPWAFASITLMSRAEHAFARPTCSSLAMRLRRMKPNCGLQRKMTRREALQCFNSRYQFSLEVEGRSVVEACGVESS